MTISIFTFWLDALWVGRPAKSQYKFRLCSFHFNKFRLVLDPVNPGTRNSVDERPSEEPPFRLASLIHKSGIQLMTRQAPTEQVLWMADCYSLAKRFPDPQAWLSLLTPAEHAQSKGINPFHYWLWMEIWQAAQNEAADESLDKKPIKSSSPKAGCSRAN